MIRAPLSCLLSSSFRFFSRIKQNSSLALNGCSVPHPCVQVRNIYDQEPIILLLITAIKSCNSVAHCGVVHSFLTKSFIYNDGFIGDQLVSLYTKLGRVEDAQTLFDELPNKDLVSWNSLISGFSRNGHLIMCLDAFCRMKLESVHSLNEVTLISVLSACIDAGATDAGNYIHAQAVKSALIFEIKVTNALINMYGKFGYTELASQLFEAMPYPNLVSWNSIIMVYVQNRVPDTALGLFKLMRSDSLKPDQATIVAMLQGCADIGIARLAELIHGFIVRAGFGENVTVMTAVLSVYAKSGRLKDSWEVFCSMAYLDRMAWTAMLGGYAIHGFGRKSIELFDLMVDRGLQPDHVTFTHLLSACSHSGLVEHGKRYFEIMYSVHDVEPRLEHYSCMVDLMGRSGHLKDAYDLIKKMPMEPNAGVWAALLNACKVYGDVEMGKEVADKLFALSPPDRRNYLLLSNIYSAAHHWEEASKIRVFMKRMGDAGVPGCSFIEHGCKIHRFVVGDRSHAETPRIYSKLEEITKKIQNIGYVPKTEFVLHDIDDKELKENMITEHSEKLAIAFGLLVTHAGMPLIITKNLRICGDCHSMAKLVSLVEKQIIIIRDTKRFHHFSDGVCSCGDFW